MRCARAQASERASVGLCESRALRSQTMSRCFSSSVQAAIVVVMVVLAGGCATAPVHRPVGPPIGLNTFEVGAGAHGVLTEKEIGGGGNAWAVYQFVDRVDLIIRGHGAELFPLPGVDQEEDLIFGGSAGIRYRFPVFKTTEVGIELLGDYLHIGPISKPERFISGIVGFAASEEAFPGVWVYTDIEIGLAVPLQDQTGLPFAGFVEVPIGVAWQPLDWLVIMGEAGAFSPEVADGRPAGYLSISTAFHF